MMISDDGNVKILLDKNGLIRSLVGFHDAVKRFPYYLRRSVYGPFTKMSSVHDVINLKTINFPIGEKPPFDEVRSSLLMTFSGQHVPKISNHCHHPPSLSPMQCSSSLLSIMNAMSKASSILIPRSSFWLNVFAFIL